MAHLRLSEYVNKGSLYDILKDEITMPSISLQMKLCFIKGLGSNIHTNGNQKIQKIDRRPLKYTIAN